VHAVGGWALVCVTLSFRAPLSFATVLQWAALNNRVPESTYLLQVPHTHKQPHMCLLWICMPTVPWPDTEVPRFPPQNGAEVNAADHTGQTALHWAAVRGSLPVLEALLRHNADATARDNRGYTVAHVAAQYGQTAVLYHLALRWNVDIDEPDADGRTPLHWCAVYCCRGCSRDRPTSKAIAAIAMAHLCLQPRRAEPPAALGSARTFP
jgi:hypothetical protein